MGKRDPRVDAYIAKSADFAQPILLTSYIKQATKLNEQGVKTTRRSKPKKELVVPAELTKALKKNKKAAGAFEKFPPSHKREYAAWISDAKGEDTRQRRVDSAIEWMAEGKSRNWKYERR